MLLMALGFLSAAVGFLRAGTQHPMDFDKQAEVPVKKRSNPISTYTH